LESLLPNLKPVSEPAALEIPPPFGSAETEILRRDSKSKSYLEKSKSYDVGKEYKLSGNEIRQVEPNHAIATGQSVNL
jgi:hypothetical protein